MAKEALTTVIQQCDKNTHTEIFSRISALEKGYWRIQGGLIIIGLLIGFAWSYLSGMSSSLQAVSTTTTEIKTTLKVFVEDSKELKKRMRELELSNRPKGR